MGTPGGIDYFGRAHPIAALQAKVSLRVRRRLYDWFLREIGGVDRKLVLDHGSTPDAFRADSNCFIRWLLADGATVYATSPEDIGNLPSIFPGLTVMPWPPRPIGNDLYDAIVSSAVIEHVGSHDSQLSYLVELFTLGKRVLITTPNRGHWLEFHTKLPFVHWLPKQRHRAVLSAIGLDFWSREENLNLLTREEFGSLVTQAASRLGLETNVSWYEPRFLGQVSNLVALVTRT